MQSKALGKYWTYFSNQYKKWHLKNLQRDKICQNICCFMSNGIDKSTITAVFFGENKMLINITFITDFRFIKGKLATQKVWPKKKAKANRNKKQRFPSGLKVSLTRLLYKWKHMYDSELHCETSILETCLYILLSLYMQNLFKKTIKHFAMKK